MDINITATGDAGLIVLFISVSSVFVAYNISKAVIIWSKAKYLKRGDWSD